MHIFSVLDGESDIISQCLQEIGKGKFTGLSKSTVSKKCLDKIIPAIQYFIQQDTIPDGVRCKHLEDNIVEFRIWLPNSKYLLRIISGYTNSEMILLTGYIIKPQAYNDKHDTAIVDKKYEEEIKAAKKIREDFVGNQKNDYTEVTEVLFPTLDSDAN